MQESQELSLKMRDLTHFEAKSVILRSIVAFLLRILIADKNSVLHH